MRYALLSLSLILTHLLIAQPCDDLKLKLLVTDTLVCAGQGIYCEAKVEGSNSNVEYLWSTNDSGPTLSMAVYEDIDISVEAFVEGCPTPLKSKKSITVISIDSAIVDTQFSNQIFTYERRLPNEIASIVLVYFEDAPCLEECHRIDRNSLLLKSQGKYQVVFQHQEQNRCIAHDTFELEVKEPAQFEPYIPNVIVPNSYISSNKHFRPYGDLLDTYEIYIFGLRGNRIFHCAEHDCYWDGRDIHGEMVASGNYVYTIKTLDLLGNENIYRGLLLLMD